MITELDQEYYLVVTEPLPSSSPAMDILIAALKGAECSFPLFRKELTSLVGAHVLNNPDGVSNVMLHELQQLIQNIHQVTDTEGRDKYIAALEAQLDAWRYCI
jgi:hypothetical protein